MLSHRHRRSVALLVAGLTCGAPAAAAIAPAHAAASQRAASAISREVAGTDNRRVGETTDRSLDATDARHALLSLINQARRRHGVRQVRLAGRVSREAERHSERMAKEGRVFSSRTRYPFDEWGENVSCGRSLEQAHEKVMSHRDSRANVLRASFRRVGIGIARSDPRRRVCHRGTFWVTEVFFTGG